MTKRKHDDDKADETDGQQPARVKLAEAADAHDATEYRAGDVMGALFSKPSSHRNKKSKHRPTTPSLEESENEAITKKKRARDEPPALRFDEPLTFTAPSLDEVRKSELETRKDDEGEEDDDDNVEEGRRGRRGASVAELTEKDLRTVFVGNVPVNVESEPLTKSQTTLKKALARKFGEFGKVESLRLRSVGLKSIKVPTGSDYRLVRKVAAVKNSFDSRVSSCSAYVVYSREVDAERAVNSVREDPVVFLGNHLRVDRVAFRTMVAGAQEEEKREEDNVESPSAETVVTKTVRSEGRLDPKRSVFVGNVVFEASEEELRRFCVGRMGAGYEHSIEAVKIVRDQASNLGKGIAYVSFQRPEDVSHAVVKLNMADFKGRELRVEKCKDTSRNGVGRSRLRGKGGGGNASRRGFEGKRASPTTTTTKTKKRIASTSGEKKKKINNKKRNETGEKNRHRNRNSRKKE